MGRVGTNFTLNVSLGVHLLVDKETEATQRSFFSGRDWLAVGDADGSGGRRWDGGVVVLITVMLMMMAATVKATVVA